MKNRIRKYFINKRREEVNGILLKMIFNTYSWKYEWFFSKAQQQKAEKKLEHLYRLKDRYNKLIDFKISLL